MEPDVQSSAPAASATPDVLNINVCDSTHYPSPFKYTKMVFETSMTGDQLRDKLVEEFGYTRDAFEIKYKTQIIEVGESRTLEQLEVVNKSIIVISRKSSAKYQDDDFKIKRNIDNQLPGSVSTALVPIGPQPNPNYHSGSSYQSTNYSYPSWNSSSSRTKLGRASCGFVGLSNQGATCYMNSLIQTLYMTPEFRLAVYKWSFEDKYKRDKEKKEKEGEENNGKSASSNGSSSGEGGAANGSNSSSGGSSSSGSSEERLKKEKVSIPLQLQRLFARLQLSDEHAVKTKDLTKSFGWEDADAFTQHDVQELCRVLFDALEKNFKGTEQENIVNDLYQGKMKDYVQCKECNNESARTDDYLDLPLVIKGFGETTAVGSVEEALQKFVTQEVLTLDNQYKCEKCNKKVDAIKGLKFVSFPYLLTLQLKRFDFDYSNMRRIKLNDRVTFPHYLDLNSFIYGDDDNNKDATTATTTATEGGDPTSTPDGDAATNHDDDTENKSDDDYDKLMSNGGHSSNNGHGNTPNGKNASNNSTAEEDFEGPPPVQPTPERPYIYELYSVLIHRGSTMGGHYYAYIKSLETNKWYEFNDSSVTDLSTGEIKKAFGGDEEGYSSYSSAYKSFKSTSNAYMLMYRKIVPGKNLKNVSNDDVPQSARDVIEGEKQETKDKRAAEEKEREMVKLKIYYPAGNANGKEMFGKELNLHKSVTLEETTKQAAALYGLTSKWESMGVSGIRLRQYALSSDLPGNTYGNQEKKTLEELGLFTTYAYSPKNLMLETREPSQDEFAEYNGAEILFKVSKFDAETNSFAPMVNLYLPRSGTFITLKEAVEARFGIPINKQRIYKEAYAAIWSNSSPIEAVELRDDYPFKGPKISEPEKYYIEECENVETEELTPGQAELTRLKNLIQVKFNIPDKQGAEESVLVDKNMTIKAFRETIQPVVGLGMEEFKIKRGSPPTCYELVAESDTLSDCNVRDGFTLVIEKGRPLKEGEITYTVYQFDLNKDADHISEIFDVTIDENSMVSDAKKVLAVKFREELQKRKNAEKKGPTTSAEDNNNNNNNNNNITTFDVPLIDPEYIRLREISNSGMMSKKVGKALCNGQTLKKALVTTKRIAIQLISEPEEVAENDICTFVQRFKPSEFELTRKEDIILHEGITVDELKPILGKKYGIPEENVGIALVDGYYNFYDDPETLSIPKLNWERKSSGYMSDWMIKNGGLVLVRDNTEPLKVLTKEEHDAIEKETKKRAALSLTGGSSYLSSYNRKEKALKIHTAE